MNESTQQMILVASPVFTTRIQYLGAQQARVVLAETGVGSLHAKRAAFAALVVANITSWTGVIATMVVGGINLIGTVVGTGATADSSATDAQILSQIATYWNALAGIDTGN